MQKIEDPFADHFSGCITKNALTGRTDRQEHALPIDDTDGVDQQVSQAWQFGQNGVGGESLDLHTGNLTTDEDRK